jgi:hypothetical protein
LAVAAGRWLVRATEAELRDGCSDLLRFDLGGRLLVVGWLLGARLLVRGLMLARLPLDAWSSADCSALGASSPVGSGSAGFVFRGGTERAGSRMGGADERRVVLLVPKRDGAGLSDTAALSFGAPNLTGGGRLLGRVPGMADLLTGLLADLWAGLLAAGLDGALASSRSALEGEPFRGGLGGCLLGLL